MSIQTLTRAMDKIVEAFPDITSIEFQVYDGTCNDSKWTCAVGRILANFGQKVQKIVHPSKIFKIMGIKCGLLNVGNKALTKGGFHSITVDAHKKNFIPKGKSKQVFYYPTSVKTLPECVHNDVKDGYNNLIEYTLKQLRK